MPQPLCSSLMTSCVLNARIHGVFKHQKMKEFEVDFEGKRIQ